MFQPIFQVGMGAEAGRTLASSAGRCPAPALNKWVGSRGGNLSVGQGFAWDGTGCRQLEEGVCVF